MLLLVACMVCLWTEARDIEGLVVDSASHVIGGATVVMQSADSAFLAVCVTDERGLYAFKGAPDTCRLVVQHQNFLAKEIIVTPSQPSVRITLERKSQRLKELVVKRQRPIVKVSDEGGLLYDPKLLTPNRPITNAWDMLEEVPGVVAANAEENAETYILSCATNTVILINGHKRYASAADLKDYLVSTLPAQVKRIEVFYSAPAQFDVQGACINVVISERRSSSLEWGGNGYWALLHGRRFYQRAGVNLNMHNKKWELEVGVAAGNTNKLYETHFEGNHQLTDATVPLAIHVRRKSGNTAKQLKMRFNCELPHHGKLSLYYVVKPETPTFDITSDFTLSGATQYRDQLYYEGHKYTHIFNGEYTHKQTTIGADYVYFYVERPQSMAREGETAYHLESFSSHKAVHGNLYFNNSHKLGSGRLSYGLSSDWWKADYSDSNTWSEGTPLDNDYSVTRQREYSLGGYVGWNHKFGKRGSLVVNLKAQYFLARQTADGETRTLWNEVSFFPNLTYTHQFSPRHKLIYSLSSQRTFPSYDQSNTARIHINSYQYKIGDASLTPATTYNAHLNYVVSNRYIIGLFAKMAPKDLVEPFYQRRDRLEGYYVWINADYWNSFGLMANVPVQWSPRFTTKFIAQAAYVCNKGTFVDVEYKRHDINGRFVINNNIALNRSKTLGLQLTAQIITRQLMAYNTMGARYGLNASLTWEPKNTGLSVVLKATDLLDRSHERWIVSQDHLNYAYDTSNDTRLISLTIRYTWRGYKQKADPKIDTSRF